MSNPLASRAGEHVLVAHPGLNIIACSRKTCACFHDCGIRGFRSIYEIVYGTVWTLELPRAHVITVPTRLIITRLPFHLHQQDTTSGCSHIQQCRKLLGKIVCQHCGCKENYAQHGCHTVALTSNHTLYRPVWFITNTSASDTTQLAS